MPPPPPPPLLLLQCRRRSSGPGLHEAAFTNLWSLQTDCCLSVGDMDVSFWLRVVSFQETPQKRQCFGFAVKFLDFVMFCGLTCRERGLHVGSGAHCVRDVLCRCIRQWSFVVRRNTHCTTHAQLKVGLRTFRPQGTHTHAHAHVHTHTPGNET